MLHRPHVRARVLVSVLNYNNTSDVLETIACYRNQTYPHFDLQVVDNASTEDCVTPIKARFPDVPVVRLPKNGGYTAGNNYALEQGLAGGYDYVLISNHDVVFGPELIAHLMETAASRPDAGVVGVVEENYKTGEIRAIGGKGFSFWRARGHWTTTPPAAGGATVLEVDYAQGALLMFSQEALRRGIRLDERLFMYCEEIDLYFQLKEKGLKAVTDLRCRVRHKSLPARFSPFQGYYLQRNRLYLCRKYGSLGAFCLALLYLALLELPVKILARSAQGHFAYARSCLRGFVDALR